MISEEIKTLLKIVNANCESHKDCVGCNFKHGDCIINLSGEIAEILNNKEEPK